MHWKPQPRNKTCTNIGIHIVCENISILHLSDFNAGCNGTSHSLFTLHVPHIFRNGTWHVLITLTVILLKSLSDVRWYISMRYLKRLPFYIYLSDSVRKMYRWKDISRSNFFRCLAGSNHGSAISRLKSAGSPWIPYAINNVIRLSSRTMRNTAIR